MSCDNKHCKTCKFWGESASDSDWPQANFCNNEGIKAAGEHPSYRERIYTKPDFGCIQWEQKEQTE